jgi:U5 small nuclear ribonucleoprotein component
VLHEDKQYYATAAETYGEDVEAMVQEEDAQPLTEPIVAPIKNRRFTVQEKNLPTTRFDRKSVVSLYIPRPGLINSFMIDMMDHPSMMRNVMVAGHIHHGKTSLLDMLVLETHQVAWDADKAVRPEYQFVENQR